ncbi:MAG: SAM-dependent methyltransferase, partial [Candidatus Puniceispirillum sp.]
MTKTRSHQIDDRLADGATSPIRADALLLARGLVSSRDRARDLIASGKVIADGRLVKKPAKLLAPDSGIDITGMVNPWVSRAGLKLASGLDAFPVVDIAGKLALDIGASTGGFTDVLLAHRAAQ